MALGAFILVVPLRGERHMHLVALGFDPCTGLLGLPPPLSLAGWRLPDRAPRVALNESSPAGGPRDTRLVVAPYGAGRTGGRSPCWASFTSPGMFACRSPVGETLWAG